MIKNLKNFTSKTNFDKCIEGIYITPEKIVATDSFKLIEITAPTGVTAPVVARLPKSLKTFECVTFDGENTITFTNKGATYTSDTRVVMQNFPDYARVIPTSEPVVTLKLSPEHLKDIAEAFAGEMTVTVEIHGALKPLVFINKEKTIRALLMPQNK